MTAQLAISTTALADRTVPVDEKPMSLFAIMAEDARAALARDPSATSLLDIVLFSTGTHIVWAHRRHHWLYTHGFKTLARLLAKRMRVRLGADIHPAATIGRRFSIDHGIGVVIGGTAIIGDDCLIYQSATLGMTGKVLEDVKRHPTLGNNVLVGAGAVILGDITVGDNTRIGAGAVVLDDVPNDVTMAGVPARIVADRRSFSLKLVEGGSGCPCEQYDECVRWSCAL